MTPLPSRDCERLSAMLALAESDQNPQDGERVAAIAAAERLLARHNLRLRDLAAPTPPPPSAAPAPPMGWRAVLHRCLQRSHRLSPWETKFLTSLGRFRRPTQRQLEVLRDIAERLSVEAAA